jgi:hypothetical protein
MANLVLTGAIANNVPGCENIGTGQKQVHWYGLQGPMRGSHAAVLFHTLCANPLIGAVASFVADGCVKHNLKYIVGPAVAGLWPEECTPDLAELATQRMRGLCPLALRVFLTGHQLSDSDLISLCLQVTCAAQCL